ncbi:MAG: 7-cyano-7-deazaguanine synthase QueC [Candidatus Omnitrophica bacterium]|jgi:7-cyano-7-deazaguanine synthase|nr:7-cyano-7-deazaguanine synthase QueC [Candidatus Omnitrophota bacterium]
MFVEKNAVILLSGGLDSAVTLYYAKDRGYKLTALIFDYKQRHKKEVDFALQLARLNNIEFYVIKIGLDWVKSSLTDKKIKVPFNRGLKNKDVPLTYVSGRNIIFLSYAASLSESIGAKSIFIGAHTQDYSGYPDCRPEFLRSFENALDDGLKYKGMKIVSPLLNKGKKEIIRLGLKLKVPFEYTWSCYQGGKTPCGKCDSCRFRITAFEELGMNDPILR